MTGNFAVNARFKSHRMTGVERYAVEVTRRLTGKIRLIAPPRFGSGLLGHFWEQLYLPLALRSPEVLWSPANSGPLLVHRQVVTIHDAFIFDHPEWFRPIFSAWYRALLPSLAHRAARVLTDSVHAQQRLSLALDIPAGHITVIPCGVDSSQFSPAPSEKIEHTRQKYRLGKEYILFVGSLEPRKNLRRLLQAWTTAAIQLPNVELVVVGGYIRHIHRKGMGTFPARTRLLGYIPDADLIALYSGAAFFVLPSLDEGAGLPALEAAACGTPCLLSKAGALPETLGENALYIDPTHVDDIAYGLVRLFTDINLRTNLSAAGKERAGATDWDVTARGVLRTLREASAE
jgi:glycosyltransferase involved in cell wall biosynthesis